MNSPTRVRETVWPWDRPPTPPKTRPLGLRVTIQMMVMAVVASIFYFFGKVWVTLFIAALAIAFLLLALSAPSLYRRKERALLRFAHYFGQALTYLLLIPFYLICFVPARLILKLRGIDHLDRAFPNPNASCWKTKPPPTGSYERQY